MEKIVILDADTIGSKDELECFNELGDVTVFGATLPENRLQNIADATIIVTNKVLIDRSVMEACPSIKLVAVTATGINNVDLACAKEKNVAVKNVAGYSTESVAQHTFASLFYLMSNMKKLDAFVASGAYADHPFFTNIQIPVTQIHGLKFGIIGMGAIGQKVAEIATAFGAEVSYYSTSGKNNFDRYPSVSLEELMTESDIVSIHAPLNESTENLIGEAELALMKPTAYVLNMGRGKIVDETALASAIKKGKPYATALDVLEYEPIQHNNPLTELIESGKVLITPHVAWAGDYARKKLISLVCDNIRVFLQENK